MQPSNFNVKVHHRSHIDKLMVLTSTYALVHSIDNGFRAFHGSLERAGHMVTAEKTTYKRVTGPNGEISYPKTPGNELRLVGQRYFQPCDVTGSTQNVESVVKRNGKTTKKTISKYSLLHDWFNVEIPKLERLQRELIRDYNVNVIVRYQWDNAGPHRDQTLNKEIKKQFDDRQWLWSPQPPQSPLLNIHDCSIFPALAKRVSNIQSLSNCNGPIDTDTLWKFVKETYYSMPLDTIARSFAYHTQMANAIHGCKGGDEYATSSSGRHCGVRKMFTPTYKLNDDGEPYGDPIGIEMVDIPNNQEEDEGHKLKYKTPIVDTSDPELMAKYLTIQELEFFMKEFDMDTPQWQNTAMAITMKQLQDD